MNLTQMVIYPNLDPPQFVYHAKVDLSCLAEMDNPHPPKILVQDFQVRTTPKVLSLKSSPRNEFALVQELVHFSCETY